MIQLPTSTIPVLTAYVSQIFSDFSPVIYLVLGTLLFFWIADWLINTLRGGNDKGDTNDL